MKYFCTRPSLASALIEAGNECEVIPNLWDPSKKEWVFTMTPEVAERVQAFYSRIGKDTPRIVADYLKKQAKKNESN